MVIIIVGWVSLADVICDLILISTSFRPCLDCLPGLHSVQNVFMMRQCVCVCVCGIHLELGYVIELQYPQA